MNRLASAGPSHAMRSLVLVALAAAACVAPRPRVDPGVPRATTLRVQLSEARAVVDLPLEEYVTGSLLAEADFRGLDAPAARRLAQVQSILARTYALANLGRHAHEGFQLCDTTHCQVYRRSDEFPDSLVAVATDAARATAGLVMSHGGQTINAVFHADCGGGTSDASVPWGGRAPPYLRGRSDSFCIRDNPPPWRFEAPRAQVLRTLEADARTSVGSQIDQIEVTEQDPAGRAVHVRLQGRDGQALVVRGEAFRAVLVGQFGFRSVKSTRFSIVEAGPQFVLEGRGFGHGVGLCQRGAAARAQDGHSPEAILTHYYPGARLTRYHSGVRRSTAE